MTEKFIRQQTNQGAVLNTDNNSLMMYKKRKSSFNEREREINNLKEEVSEIKCLLKELLKEIKQNAN